MNIQLTSAEILEFYNMSPMTLRKLCKEGLPFEKITTKLYKYNYADVEAFLNIDGKVYPYERNLINMKGVRELTGLDRNRVYREMNDYRLPFYEINGTAGNTMYRFDETEVLEWHEDYKERWKYRENPKY